MKIPFRMCATKSINIFFFLADLIGLLLLLGHVELCWLTKSDVFRDRFC